MSLTKPDESILDLTSTGLAIDQVQSNLDTAEADLYDYINNRTNILSKTSSYDIQDSDLANYSKLIIYSDPRTGNQVYTLPTLADNQGKIVRIQVTDLGGKVTLDGEGAETIGGYSALYMQSKNNFIEVIGEAGEWQILDYNISMETGMINETDYTNRALGSSVANYDNLSGTFIEGEVVTESISGNTGIIMFDSGIALFFKNVTGTGIWTNNRTLTGSISGATALVNETSGSSINQNQSIYHYLNLNINQLTYKIIISPDGTYTNALEPAWSDTSGARTATWRNVDSNKIQFITDTSAFEVLPSAGSGGVGPASYPYYNIVIEAKL